MFVQYHGNNVCFADCIDVYIDLYDQALVYMTKLWILNNVLPYFD